jgi:predicted ABC-type ATPase
VECKGLAAIDELPLAVFGGSGTVAATTAAKETGGVSRIDSDEAAAAESPEDPSDETHRLDALVSGLQISSQLARNSEKHYGALSGVFTAQKLHWILTETNATAASKCCNLIGNLCR